MLLFSVIYLFRVLEILHWIGNRGWICVGRLRLFDAYRSFSPNVSSAMFCLVRNSTFWMLYILGLKWKAFDLWVGTRLRSLFSGGWKHHGFECGVIVCGIVRKAPRESFYCCNEGWHVKASLRLLRSAIIRVDVMKGNDRPQTAVSINRGFPQPTPQSRRYAANI